MIDTPISNWGAGSRSAPLTGMRPIFEFQFSDFATLAMEQIVNQAAKMRFMLGGEVSVPVVMRFPAGSGTGAAAQHSQSLEAWLGHVPGLKVIQPATPYDAKGMLLAAVADPDPVMIFEHKLLYKMKGPVPEGYYTVPIGKADIRRGPGSHHRRHLDHGAEALGAAAGRRASTSKSSISNIRPMDKRAVIDGQKTSRLIFASTRQSDAGHRRRGQRHDRRAGVRLSRCADRAAGRRRDADPLQSGTRKRRCANSDVSPVATREVRWPMPTEVIL